MPTTRYAEVSVRVREICERLGWPTRQGPLHHQYAQVLRTIHKLALPNGLTSDDSPPPPPSPIDRGRRLTDAERPTRRLGDRGRGRAPRSADGAAPTPTLAERPRDTTYDVPVPFACPIALRRHRVKKLSAPVRAQPDLRGCAGESLSWGVTLVGAPGPRGEAGGGAGAPSCRPTGRPAAGLRGDGSAARRRSAGDRGRWARRRRGASSVVIPLGSASLWIVRSTWAYWWCSGPVV